MRFLYSSKTVNFSSTLNIFGALEVNLIFLQSQTDMRFGQCVEVLQILYNIYELFL